MPSTREGPPVPPPLDEEPLEELPPLEEEELPELDEELPPELEPLLEPELLPELPLLDPPEELLEVQSPPELEPLEPLELDVQVGTGVSSDWQP